MFDWLSIQRARFSSAVRCSITAMTCKKADSKSRIRTLWPTAPAAKALLFRENCFTPSDGTIEPPAEANELHLHDLGILVLEMIVDRFDEAIRELLHFFLHIAQPVLSQFAGRLEFLRFVERGAAVRAHTHTRFLGHFAQGTHQ